MLRIRLTRTGRTKQESFRIVVAEHARPVKGKFIEVIGHYQPSKNPKAFDIEKARVEYWMSKGAQPSSTVASLLKKHGMGDMDKFMHVRQKDIKPKGTEAEKKDTSTSVASAPKKENEAAPASAKEEAAPVATPAA